MAGVLRRFAFASLLCALGLGVGARVVMRLIARLSGLPASFSTGGSLEVVLFGVLIGLPVAISFFAVRGRLRTRIPVGVVIGAAVFAVLALWPPGAARGALNGTPDPPGIAALMFGGLFLLFGAVLEWIWRRAGAAKPATTDRLP